MFTPSEIPCVIMLVQDRLRRPHVGVTVSETWGEGHKIQELEVKVMDLRDLGVSVM
jgi:hypothetical protein